MWKSIKVTFEQNKNVTFLWKNSASQNFEDAFDFIAIILHKIGKLKLKLKLY